MASKTSWFADAAAFVRSQAGLSYFPGEADPVYKALDKFADKLLGECHNGAEYGSDGCVACRATRCDQAEKALGGVIEARDAANVEASKAKDTAERAKIVAKAAQDETAEANKRAFEYQSAIGKAVEDAARAKQAALDEATERAAAQRNSEADRYGRDRAEEATKVALKEIYRLKDLATEMVK